MELNFSQLLALTGAKALLPPDGQMVMKGVQSDSRLVEAGDVFVAVSGTRSDGHVFLRDAFERGAVCALVESAEELASYPGAAVQDSRRALSKLADFFAGSPSNELLVSAVTGTNGKTTTHWIISHLLEALGQSNMRIGTLGVHASGIIDEPPALTTPDPIRLQQLMALARDSAIRHVVMEASSHALDQKRVEDIKFDIAVYTNLTLDHLDYHGSMQSYFDAKRRLFELMAEGASDLKAAVVNIDCEYGRRLATEIAGKQKVKLIRYGFGQEADLRVLEFDQRLAGSRLKIRLDGVEAEFETGFIGDFNALNLAAAIGAVSAYGFELSELGDALGRLPQVPGRLESVGAADFGVYVDFSHTPDALKNALLSLRSLVQNELWVVFGCGGDRDRSKRPEMGRIAGELADKVVVTSDNPRFEDPQKIIDDILESGVKAAHVTPDRREGIRAALMSARPGDVVLVAGKGHETYQDLGGQKVHFSDVEEVRNILQNEKFKG